MADVCKLLEALSVILEVNPIIFSSSVKIYIYIFLHGAPLFQKARVFLIVTATSKLGPAQTLGEGYHPIHPIFLHNVNP